MHNIIIFWNKTIYFDWTLYSVVDVFYTCEYVFNECLLDFENSEISLPRQRISIERTEPMNLFGKLIDLFFRFYIANIALLRLI